MTEITTMLAAARDGDDAAAGSAFSLLYDDLRRLAHSRLRQHKTMTLLNTTSLPVMKRAMSKSWMVMRLFRWKTGAISSPMPRM